MPYSRACVVRSTAARMPPPSRSSTSVVAGLKYSEHGLSRGKRARSSSNNEAPARGGNRRAVGPAGPAPTPPPRLPPPETGDPLPPPRTRGSAHGGRQVDAVVVQPSPTGGEPDRLVAHRRAALEPRVAPGALVLALERSEER